MTTQKRRERGARDAHSAWSARGMHVGRMGTERMWDAHDAWRARDAKDTRDARGACGAQRSTSFIVVHVQG